MQLTVNVRGMEALRATIDGFSARRLAAAQATALTRTAVQVRDTVKARLPRVFDRPTPYTLASLYAKGATATSLQAGVGFKDESSGASSSTPATKYLGPHTAGGGRHVKRMEKALQARGAMPQGWFAVPASGARLDAYGNVSRGQVQQIISQLGTELLTGDSRTLRRRPGETDAQWQARRRKAYGKAGGQYTAVSQPRGKLKPGIYLAQARDFGRKLGLGRTGRLVPVFIFVRAIRYQARFDFEGMAQQLGQQILPAELQRAVADHVRALAKPGAQQSFGGF